MTRTPSPTADRRPKTTIDAGEAFFGYYPGTVAVVTAHHEGVANVMSAGWHTALSAEPPLYGVAVAPERRTHPLIRGAGWFGVHFLPFARAEAIAGAGVLSGADVPDKPARLDLAWHEDPSGVPILDDAYLAYACRVRDVVPTGDHDFFVGEVVRLHVDEAAFDGRLQDSRAVPAVVYYGRSRYEALGAGEVATFTPERFRDDEAAT